MRGFDPASEDDMDDRSTLSLEQELHEPLYGETTEQREQSDACINYVES